MGKKFEDVKRELFYEFEDVDIPSCFHLHGVLARGMQRLLEIATRQEAGESVEHEIQPWLAGLSALADHAAIALGVANEKSFEKDQNKIDRQQVVGNLKDMTAMLEKYIDDNGMMMRNPQQPLKTISVIKINDDYINIMQEIDDLLENLS